MVDPDKRELRVLRSHLRKLKKVTDEYLCDTMRMGIQILQRGIASHECLCKNKECDFAVTVLADLMLDVKPDFITMDAIKARMEEREQERAYDDDDDDDVDDDDDASPL
ncbi:MAG: hypothetical protein KDD44_00300 [Bdellovibrionales bacterium]|nr:hypothetical protein [Bdellovibrionales bacterium]